MDLVYHEKRQISIGKIKKLAVSEFIVVEMMGVAPMSNHEVPEYPTRLVSNHIRHSKSANDFFATIPKKV